MKLLIVLIFLHTTGCTLIDKQIEKGFIYNNTVTEENYKKTPCFVDGQIVKPKKN